jgi:hypothetical protein
LGINGSAVCVSVCQTLTPVTFNKWPLIFPCIQNTVGICKHVTFLIPYKVSFMLVTHGKFIYISIKISDILVLTVCLKLVNFTFSILPVFPLKYQLVLSHM